MHVLIVEDDPEIADMLNRALRDAGYTVQTAGDGQAGMTIASTKSFDAIVLDRLLPGLDGLSVLSALRSRGVCTPVLILSALGDVNERIAGLRAGGDDYLTKPFVIDELIARLEVITRRMSAARTETVVRIADLELDRATRLVKRAGETLLLTPREYRILEFLFRHAGMVVTRTMLLEGVWEYRFDPQTNIIDVHMSRLRGKVDRAPWPALIQTLRGTGYCLSESI